MVRPMLMATLTLLLVSGCHNVRRYDATEEPVVSKEWGHKDLQDAAQALSQNFGEWSAKQPWTTKPVVYFSQVTNKTADHVDTKNITDRIRVLLLNKGAVRFTAANEAQDEILRQLRFQQGSLVDPATAKQIGKQIGADYFLFGELTEIIEKSGRKTGVYYKLTLSLVNVETAIIEWSADAAFQKVESKGIFGG